MTDIFYAPASNKFKLVSISVKGGAFDLRGGGWRIMIPKNTCKFTCTKNIHAHDQCPKNVHTRSASRKHNVTWRKTSVIHTCFSRKNS